MLRTLTFTTLFPNAAQPVHGIFVANRLSHLLATGAATTQIVAPVPWFPFSDRRFGTYARYAAAPRREEFRGCPVFHPRFPVIPRIGMNISPALLYMGALRAIETILRSGFDFDLIDAHYFYPDGVAAILLGRRFGKPVVITARGSDISQIADFPLPRRMILWAAREAACVVTVCQALKDRLCELGADPGRVQVLRNGVDLTLFHPRDDIAGAGARGRTVVSVGHLIPRKGHDIVIDAIAEIPEVRLLVIGDGPERLSLQRQCQARGVADRVSFLGQISPQRLSEIYAGADALVLASSHEGWANVLLEAMACGTPVVASNVWGTPEVVAEDAAGLLVEQRSGPAFARAIRQLLARPPDRRATRAYAERFSWDATTAGQIALFTEILAARRSRAAPPVGRARVISPP